MVLEFVRGTGEVLSDLPFGENARVVPMFDLVISKSLDDGGCLLLDVFEI